MLTSCVWVFASLWTLPEGIVWTPEGGQDQDVSDLPDGKRRKYDCPDDMQNGQYREWEIKFGYHGSGRQIHDTNSNDGLSACSLAGNADYDDSKITGPWLDMSYEGRSWDPNPAWHAGDWYKFRARHVIASLEFDLSIGGTKNFHFTQVWEAAGKPGSEGSRGWQELDYDQISMVVDVKHIKNMRFPVNTFRLNVDHTLKFRMSCETSAFEDLQVNLIYVDGENPSYEHYLPDYTAQEDIYWRDVVRAMYSDAKIQYNKLVNQDDFRFNKVWPSVAVPWKAQFPDWCWEHQGGQPHDWYNNVNLGETKCAGNWDITRTSVTPDPAQAPACVEFVSYTKGLTVAPTPSPTPSPPPGAEGDPHCRNIKGEKFDVRRVGEVPMILIPLGLSAQTANISLVATTALNGWSPCAASFIVKIELRVYQCRTVVFPGPLGAPEFKMDPCSNQTRVSKTLSTIKLMSNALNVWIQQITPPSQMPPYLNLDVSGTALGTAGGILGNDDYADYTAPPDQCDGPLLDAGQRSGLRGSYAKASE